jgi:hypothetical protein
MCQFDSVAKGIYVSFRAANLIELNEGFEADVNSEFFADVSDVYERGCDEGF